MKILNMIRSGEYTKGQEPGGYNGFGQYSRGADVYQFGNGIELHTYTHDCWWLYIDGEIMPKADRGISDTDICKAFKDARQAKFESIS